jgi:hypothetical protein
MGLVLYPNQDVRHADRGHFRVHTSLGRWGTSVCDVLSTSRLSWKWQGQFHQELVQKREHFTDRVSTSPSNSWADFMTTICGQIAQDLTTFNFFQVTGEEPSMSKALHAPAILSLQKHLEQELSSTKKNLELMLY